MTTSLERLKADGCELCNVEAWVREKPWWALGAGAAAGFLAGRLAFSSPAEPGSSPRRGRGRSWGTWIAPLVTPLVRSVAPALLRGLDLPRGGDSSESSLQDILVGPLFSRLIRGLS